jgi:hypothetical protein
MINRHITPVLVCLILLTFSGPVVAQEPTLPQEAEDLIQTFFLMSDEAKYEETYGLAPSILQKIKTRSFWANMIRSDRDRMGEIKSRKLIRVERAESFLDLPEGQYLKAVFKTEFSKQTEAEETVVLVKIKDGGYGLAGYEIEYNRWPEAIRIIVNGLLAVVFIMVLLATITWVIGRVIQRMENNKPDKEKG